MSFQHFETVKLPNGDQCEKVCRTSFQHLETIKLPNGDQCEKVCQMIGSEQECKLSEASITQQVSVGMVTDISQIHSNPILCSNQELNILHPPQTGVWYQIETHRIKVEPLVRDNKFSVDILCSYIRYINKCNPVYMIVFKGTPKDYTYYLNLGGRTITSSRYSKKHDGQVIDFDCISDEGVLAIFKSTVNRTYPSTCVCLDRLFDAYISVSDEGFKRKKITNLQVDLHIYNENIPITSSVVINPIETYVAMLDVPRYVYKIRLPEIRVVGSIKLEYKEESFMYELQTIHINSDDPANISDYSNKQTRQIYLTTPKSLDWCDVTYLARYEN